MRWEFLKLDFSPPFAKRMSRLGKGFETRHFPGADVERHGTTRASP